MEKLLQLVRDDFKMCDRFSSPERYRPTYASSTFPGSCITTIFNFGYVSLNIMHLRDEDSGLYTVRAINRHGEAISQSSMRVIGKVIFYCEFWSMPIYLFNNHCRAFCYHRKHRRLGSATSYRPVRRSRELPISTTPISTRA